MEKKDGKNLTRKRRGKKTIEYTLKFTKLDKYIFAMKEPIFSRKRWDCHFSTVKEIHVIYTYRLS